MFLSNVFIFEFFLSKSDGIDYISKVGDKCQKSFKFIYIERIAPQKSLKKSKFLLSGGTLYTWARTKLFWIWFICTLEGCVVPCFYLFLEKSANLKHPIGHIQTYLVFWTIWIKKFKKQNMFVYVQKTPLNWYSSSNIYLGICQIKKRT